MTTLTPPNSRKPSWRFALAHLLQTAGMLLVIGGVLFVSAGRLDWWEAWAFLTLYFIIALATAVWLLRTNPELAQERNRPGPGVKLWDSLLIRINLLLTLGLYVVTGLDAGRLALSNVPWAVRAAGLLGLIPAFGLPLWAAKVNTYLSSRVRLQPERGQEVVAAGPYRYIRHPMYAGMLCYGLSVPLMLGSWWGLGVAGAMNLTVVLRTLLEDRLLQRKLPGYREYSQRVRYRLFPGVW
jgi:protein-S-isoprenylcysteine O-methyltransferase Ste14